MLELKTRYVTFLQRRWRGNFASIFYLRPL